MNNREKTTHCLNNLTGNKYNAYTSILSKRALKQAVLLDNLPEGSTKPLLGMQVAVKDNIAVSGEYLTCGSNILKSFISPYSATVVRRLENAGAIIVAKTNMDEFGMGSSSDYSAFGPVLNPHDGDLSPGGSSGGSAAAVACGDVPVALGSDTGGSIRQPAAFCGVSGLRPTYGSMSRFGLVSFCSSMDQIGPIAKKISEIENVFEICKGKDPRDMTSLDPPKTKNISPNHKKQIRIATASGLSSVIKSNAVDKAVSTVINTLSDAGQILDPVSLPDFSYCLAAYQIISSAEAASNLARYDGIRYASTSDEFSEDTTCHDSIRYVRSKGFGKEVKRRILTGTAVLSRGFRRDLYGKACAYRNHVSQYVRSIFSTVDLLVLPTTPSLPFKRGKNKEDPVKMYESDILTVVSSLAGCPSLSMPVPDTSQHIPASIQIIAAPFQEHCLFDTGKYLESQWGR